MKTPLMLVAVVVLAGSAFGQAKVPAEPSQSITESRPPISTRAVAQPDHRFRARFSNSCCFDINSAPVSDDSVIPFASVEIVHAQGGPDWQASNFMMFQQAVRLGQQQAALAPRGSNPAMVQQMLELIQQVRAVKDQNRLNGNTESVKWADLKGTLDTADYRRPPSTFMDYSQALALGEKAQTPGTQQPVSLVDAAREASESKPAGEKAKVAIKQDDKGNPVIVEKKP